MSGFAHGRARSVGLIARQAVWVAIASVASGTTASGQGRMITLSAAEVRQGQRVTVTSPVCLGALTLLVDGKLFPATVNGTAFELPTVSLAPATYSITTGCAGVASDPVLLRSPQP